VRTVYCSTACFPRASLQDAVRRIRAGVIEPVFGPAPTDVIQIAPQFRGVLRPETAAELRALAPETQFRLHANLRVDASRHALYDMTFRWDELVRFMRSLAEVNAVLRAPVYSVHPGRRAGSTLKTAFDNARRCADLLGIPVAIEGMYPHLRSDLAWLIETWADYRALFESGVPYAIDMSHVNLLVEQTRRIEIGLLGDMLACERCVEIHVSANDGLVDSHAVVIDPPWWMPLLRKASRHAVVFTEGRRH
jgi:hypothetical protein